MGSKKDFLVGVLSDWEAKNLFQEDGKPTHALNQDDV
jgi:hypothetical protein